MTATTATDLTVPGRWTAGRHPARLPARWLAGAVVVGGTAFAASVALGPVGVPLDGAARELLDRLPLVDVDSGLAPTQAAIVTQVRLPRAVLAFLVGAVLATAGGAYQGVFRNPLADPYLLGAASGAGPRGHRRHRRGRGHARRAGRRRPPSPPSSVPSWPSGSPMPSARAPTGSAPTPR